MSGIDLNVYNPTIQEYKGFRYFMVKHSYWTCGYILIDLDLFQKLNLRYYQNVTSIFASLICEITDTLSSVIKKEINNV